MSNWIEGIEDLRLPALQSGSHNSPEKGLCAMEMVAFIERLPHSDSPPCTCPVITAYVRKLNDRMTSKERQRLLEYLPRLVGTVSKKHELERATVAAWRAVKVFAPLALQRRWPEKAKLLREFDETRGLREAAIQCRAAADAAAAAAAAYAADAADAAAATYAADAADAATYAADAADAATYAAAYAADAADAAAATYAADAADAATYAADAADAAADAAAADAAADAAAADAAADAARQKGIAAALQLLDDMLAIGPQGKWSKPIDEPLRELQAMVSA